MPQVALEIFSLKASLMGSHFPGRQRLLHSLQDLDLSAQLETSMNSLALVILTVVLVGF
jgi:hypothetical protein